jgi:hypothetical protein
MNFIECLVGTSKTKGLRTPLQSNPTPCKNKDTQHNNNWAQPESGFVLVNDQKRGQCDNFGRSWVCEKMGKKWRNVDMGVMGRPAVAMGGGTVMVVVPGEWPEVIRWWFG